MTVSEFVREIEKHPELRGLGVKVSFAVASDATGGTWDVDLAAVKKHAWEELRGVMLGKRPALILTQMTRIVGYFSLTRNWNRSKIQELHDRRKGNYDPEAREKLVNLDLPALDEEINALLAETRVEDMTCTVPETSSEERKE